jgi:hypothetical protein
LALPSRDPSAITRSDEPQQLRRPNRSIRRPGGGDGGGRTVSSTSVLRCIGVRGIIQIVPWTSRIGRWRIPVEAKYVPARTPTRSTVRALFCLSVPRIFDRYLPPGGLVGIGGRVILSLVVSVPVNATFFVYGSLAHHGLSYLSAEHQLGHNNYFGGGNSDSMSRGNGGVPFHDSP